MFAVLVFGRGGVHGFHISLFFITPQMDAPLFRLGSCRYNFDALR